MRINNTKTVGITGGIGAGKSIISRIFSILGVPVYEADSRAKKLMASDSELQSQIIEKFGDESYQEGQLNRVYLAKLVFSDPDKTALINSLVHPAVAQDFQKWVAKQKTAYVLKEAALLFESGSYKYLDHVITVTAAEEVRINRVLARDLHRNKEDVEHIIARQWAEERKIELSDFVITNDQSELVIPQVLTIHQKLSGQI